MLTGRRCSRPQRPCRSSPICHCSTARRHSPPVHIWDPGVVQPGEDDTVTFSIQGTDGTALEHAEVYLIGGTFPVRGVTGPDGQVTLTLPAGSVPTIRGICVKPRFDYWSVWLGDPDLSQDPPT